MTLPAADEPRVAPFRLPAGLDTPAVVVDLARADANIARLQADLDAAGVANRPHAKTHKSIAIGRRQVAAGARGLTVGTLGEAEVFAAAGLDDLFVAYPVWADGPKAARLRELHDALGEGLAVGVDSAGGAERLAAAVAGAGAAQPLRVLVEVDPGNGRTGVVGAEAAVAVAASAGEAGLRVDGVFAHGGHGYRPGAAGAAGADEVRTLGEAASALRDAGFEAPIVSAGSTPTRHAAATGPITEIRAGTTVYGDHQQVVLGSIRAEDCALVIAATVVSVRDGGFVLDAGAKALTKDRAEWLPGYGSLPAWPEATIERLADYHGIVRLPAGVAGPALGAVVAIVPNHVCPVVDVVDAFTVVLPDGATERWPVDARGRSS